MQGLLFEIKNEFGKQLADILVDIAEPSWCWSINLGESHKMETPDTNFLSSNAIMDGETFLNEISTGKYYLIFADLKAFPTREDVVEVKNYEDFLNSSCQLALLIIDSVYVSLVLKEQRIVHKFFERAEALGYSNIKLLTDENDTSKLFSVWG